ncbi:MAG: hypothetical protein KDD10_29235, partial [Phaeodactylibacter sp.]|nr:hypothetical protein [Phaeodactylibacter sp.]
RPMIFGRKPQHILITQGMKNSTSNFSIGTGWPICWSKSLIPLFLLLTACEKWDLDQANFPEVSTVGFDPAANPTEVILYGQISGLVENDFASNHGHIWSLTPDSLSVGATVGQSLFGQKGNGSFQSKAQELSPGNTYYYRSYLVYENQPPIYGAIKAFNTESLSPELSIDSISREGEFTIRILTAISGLPVGLPLTSFGITWSQDSLPDIEKDAIVPEQGIIVFEPEFKFESEAVLPTGQSYLRPYLLVGNEVYYGDSKPYKIGNIWNQTADFSGGPRFGAIGFSIGQKGYVGTGNDGGNHKKDFWEYDPLAGTWTQRADFGGGL